MWYINSIKKRGNMEEEIITEEQQQEWHERDIEEGWY